MMPSVDEREERVRQNELRQYSLDDTDMAALTHIIEEEGAMSGAVAGCRTRVPEPVTRLVLIPDVLSHQRKTHVATLRARTRYVRTYTGDVSIGCGWRGGARRRRARRPRRWRARRRRN